jgi:hypothetical protein
MGGAQGLTHKHRHTPMRPPARGRWPHTMELPIARQHTRQIHASLPVQHGLSKPVNIPSWEPRCRCCHTLGRTPTHVQNRRDKPASDAAGISDAASPGGRSGSGAAAGSTTTHRPFGISSWSVVAPT